MRDTEGLSIIEFFLANHELEVQTDSDERHEVKTDGAEDKSNRLVTEAHQMEGPVGIFTRVIVSELRDW